MQITVRLRRKAGVDALGKTVRNVLINNFGQKVIYVFHHNYFPLVKSGIRFIVGRDTPKRLLLRLCRNSPSDLHPAVFNDILRLYAAG